MAIFWFLIISYILLSFSLYKVFEKAGEEGWKGLAPGLNFVVWCKLIGRKPTYALWLLFPIVNLFIFVGMAVDLVRSFGKYTFLDSALAVIYAPLAFFLTAANKDAKYLGPTLIAEKVYRAQLEEAREKNDARTLRKLEAANPYHKSQAREWVEAIVFAVFAAAFIRMFLIEAYTIPTPSMEDSLLVGDFLFVSKAHYGVRTPKTIAMVPLLHNRMPFINRESYHSSPSLPYTRLPALETIDRNDPIVFNFPEGDSVYVFPERTFSVYDYRRGAITQQRAAQIKNGQAPLVVRPLDKKDHYIKRCIGVPGDSIEVRNRQVYINGKPAVNPSKLAFTYLVTFPETLNRKDFSEWGISNDDQGLLRGDNALGEGYQLLTLTEEQKAKIQAMDNRIKIIPNTIYRIRISQNLASTLTQAGITPAYQRGQNDNSLFLTLDSELISNIQKIDSTIIISKLDDSGRLFPQDPKNFSNWDVDNYGPVWIPKKGATVTLTPQNIALFRRAISVYEGNTLEEKAGKFIINGQETNQYTFKQDYYWAMGDNRHNSEDSRVWGYVPHDHIVGKPLFIWFSLKEGSLSKGINWSRIFTSASKM